MCLSGGEAGTRRRRRWGGRSQVGSCFEWQLDSATFPKSTKHLLFSFEPPLTEVWGLLQRLSLLPRQAKGIIPFYLLSSDNFSSFPPLVYILRSLFSSLFAVRCGGCAEAISPTELVMRAQATVFHLRCFTCSVCSCRLQTGDRCVLRDGQLLCAREDYHRCLASPTSSDTGTCCLQCVGLCMCVAQLRRSLIIGLSLERLHILLYSRSSFLVKFELVFFGSK